MTRNRTSAEDLHLLAEADLIVALREAGFEPVEAAPAGDSSYDLAAGFDGMTIKIDVVAVAYADPSRLSHLVQERAAAEDNENAGVVQLVVADHVPEPSLALLGDAGWSWFDRRGRLRVRSRGLSVDVRVDPRTRASERPRRQELSGRNAITLAFELLVRSGAGYRQQPGDVDRISPSDRAANRLRMSQSTLSRSFSQLRDLGLVDGALAPDGEALFWQTSDAWALDTRYLSVVPAVSATLELDKPRWAEGGAAAAAVLGVPAVVSAATTVLYVPGPVDLTTGVRRYGEADPPSARASISVAPAWQVTDRRYLWPPLPGGRPVVHPLVIAFELARDRARGLETLESWDGAGFRVW